MSSILKALKKLEAEKAARLSGQVEISRAILSENASRKKRRPSVPVLAGVLLALLVLVSGITLWRSQKTSVPLPHSTAEAPRLPAQPIPEARVRRPPSVTVPATSPTPTPPERLANQRPAAVRPFPTLPSPRELPPRPAPGQAVAAPASRPQPAPTAVPAPAEATARPAPAPAFPPPHAVPTLRVSGIAWQKDGASRLAIVNGQPVGQGASVSGATVDEIFPDLVRFSFKGERIEVGLGKSSKDN